MRQQDRTLRIIGGKWRGRKVTFADHDSLRPTSDRVRETLFNWLMHDIGGASCLDLFAGSGILSLEALSRGASQTTIVEQNHNALASIKTNIQALQIEKPCFELVQADALVWLTGCSQSFDVIFLDPPFAGDALYRACQEISERALARQFVYLETSAPIDSPSLPANWAVHREKSTGSVHYALCSTNL
jgi:16S rRNA (guanine966-N2)-methyltransferase